MPAKKRPPKANASQPTKPPRGPNCQGGQKAEAVVAWRVTASQKAEIEDAARAQNLTVAEFLRSKALKGARELPLAKDLPVFSVDDLPQDTLRAPE